MGRIRLFQSGCSQSSYFPVLPDKVNESSGSEIVIVYLLTENVPFVDKPQFLADVVVSSDRAIETPFRPFSQSVISRNILSSQVNLSILPIEQNLHVGDITM